MTNKGRLDEGSVRPEDSVEICGKGSDETGAYFIQFAVKGKKLAPIPFSFISNRDSFFAIFNAAGANLFQQPSRQKLLAKIEAASLKDTFTVPTRLGWYETKVFVLPGRVIGQSDHDVQPSLTHLPPEMLTKYCPSGTLADWQSQILPLCTGNSRLIFAICWAFASALAALIPQAIVTGGFQIFGAPETGKTTAVTLAGSVWGNHLPPNLDRGFMETWHSTAGKLADTFAAHADIGLPLDELSYFTGDVHQTVMHVASGAGRQRLNQIGQITYRSLVLSTSNKPSWQYPSSGAVSLEAVLSRLTDIPMPSGGAGIFENLHEFVTGSELAEALTSACHAQHGNAGPAFIESILASDRDIVLKRATRFRARYKENLIELADDEKLKALKRPLDRFATVYAAGRLASEFGIVPWSKQEIREAILACHLDALRVLSTAFQPAKASESASLTPSQRLVEYLEKHRRNFIDLEAKPLSETHEFGSASGYRATMKGKKWWYISADRFKEIAGGTKAAHGLKTQLRALRLVPRGAGLTVQRPIYRGKKGNKGWRRVVALRARSLKRYRKLLG